MDAEPTHVSREAAGFETTQRPAPVFGVASLAALAVGALLMELLSLVTGGGEEALVAGGIMLIVVGFALVGSISAAIVALRRHERFPGFAWASFGLIAMIVVWLAGLLWGDLAGAL